MAARARPRALGGPRFRFGSDPLRHPDHAADGGPVAVRGGWHRVASLAVATESASHAWTREDAKDPAVIDRLAHGPEEFLRMVEENDRIKRRQLVYRKEPVALLLEQARASGVPLTRFTLPVLDGAEVEVEVLETQIDGHRGAVIGRIVGQPDSLACVGFSGSCESFNILAPSSGLFIAADAREPGEVILKEIDPAVYSPMACGGPLTAQN